MNRSVIITGVSGGIGGALCRAFSGEGYRVIGIDRTVPSTDVVPDVFLELDLESLCRDPNVRDAAFARIREAVMDMPLHAIVNNAAIQVVKSAAELTVTDWIATLHVNLLAPFLLVQGLLPELEASRGAVVNISSIHARLTKRGFTAYATSKAALDGLTRSLAVELGARVRINAIAPGAIATPMLVAGFSGRVAQQEALDAMHPVGRIGDPAEVAQLALYLVSDAAAFVNGAAVALDGGIGGRLHDPD